MMLDEEPSRKLAEFNAELTHLLKIRFKFLARRMNGSGVPTAEDLSHCALSEAIRIQQNGADRIEDYLFTEIMGTLIEHPEYGESLRPFYNFIEDKLDI